MQKLFTDTRILDRIAIADCGLTEDILMENAAASLENVVRTLLQQNSVYHNSACGDQSLYNVELNGDAEIDVLIVTGRGDNGADGMALARRIAAADSPMIKSAVFEVAEPMSAACIRQKERAEKAGAVFLPDIVSCRVLVDCLFGSGFHGTADSDTVALISRMNAMNCVRIACDIPSAGLVRADITVTMGALKTVLYGEKMKDVTGTIICADLGLSRTLYESGAENERTVMLLEKSDLALPERHTHLVNKGSFGHCAVAIGDKLGAGVIAGTAAFAFGAGLVTLVHADDATSIVNCPFEMMQSSVIPPRTTAAAIGMGLGSATESWALWARDNPETAVILDADICRSPLLPEVLAKRFAVIGSRTVVTPHPLEFQQMLQNCGLGSYTMEEIIEKRLELSSSFCHMHPGIVLILKGSSPVITVVENNGARQYVNPLGLPCLAKGGSGDVLSGLVGALLAQGYCAELAALQASIAHTLASQKQKSSYGMTPFTLIESIRTLGIDD